MRARCLLATVAASLLIATPALAWEVCAKAKDPGSYPPTTAGP
jgi:hypothetical protein